MPQHIVTKNIGNLRGFSTDSLFIRPPNVAEEAINIQRAPDGTLQIRRGYQCQIAYIGGAGLGTFDNPVEDTVQTVTIGLDGFAYNKLQKQIYFHYNGTVTGQITGVSNTVPTDVTSTAHGMASGTHIIIRDVGGIISLNDNPYVIDVTGVNNFDLYDLSNTGIITGASNTNPCAIESENHGLITGDQIFIQNVGGMEVLGVSQLNNLPFTITFIDVDHFSLDGVDSTAFSLYTSGGFWALAVDTSLSPVYTSGGYWTIDYTENRYLNFTIFTDPRFLPTNPGWSIQPWSFSPWGSPSGESISCNITVNRAAKVNGLQINTNTLIVYFGHEIASTDVIKFIDTNGILQQRTVTSTTLSSITFSGYPVDVSDGTFISQFFDILFRKGFDTTSPYLISTFLSTITNPTTGIYGLGIAVNGDTDLAAAFLQIIEPTIIDKNRVFKIDYWYWQQINYTFNPPLPGSASTTFQNSDDFEIASMASYDDVLYIANGLDYPQKYDGQTIYRTGMPQSLRPTAQDDVAYTSLPFVTGEVYEYGITYEQVDNIGHFVEGEISEIRDHTVVAANAAIEVTVSNLATTLQNNWNTNSALADAGQAVVYGPDIDGNYYNFVPVVAGVTFTMKIGDSAYYADTTSSVISGASTNTNKITVAANQATVVGDLAYFFDSSSVQRVREVTEVDGTSFTVFGTIVTVDGAVHSDVLVYKVSKVFGNVAIVDLNQLDVNTINVLVNFTIQMGDVVEFIDIFDRLQRRTVTAVGATDITIDGIPVSVSNLLLISSTNQRSDAITLQRQNSVGITFTANSPISNNLRINIYRTIKNTSFANNASLFLVASIPNSPFSFGAFQAFVDGIPDSELAFTFDDPDRAPNPPPISKYVRAFGNQMFYGGGERNVAENSDNVFFSEGKNPEIVPLASNSIDVPNLDDDITGIGVSGTTFVITKNHSLWGVTGNFLKGNAEVIQIAPGTNIGCISNASIQAVGGLMYFLHTNGVYAISENQLYPTDSFGNPVAISLAIEQIFRENKFLPQTRYVLKRSVAINYSKDNQYILFLPCENPQSGLKVANTYSTILAYDYSGKNWFQWTNMNAAGGMVVIEDDLFFQERRFSGVDGNTANLYKQHRFYRLVDHADHAGPQRISWKSSWSDLGQPEVRKKFSKCILLMDRLSDLMQFNNPQMRFSSYLNRLPNLRSTMSVVTQTDNIRNSSWSYSGWGWNSWSGYQDSFITINLKQGTVAKSIQVGFTIEGINMDMKFAGFQLDAIPENRVTVVR